MAQAQKKKELQIMTEDKAGMLAEVTGLASSAGVNLEAICAYGMGDKGTFLLVTSDNKKVKEAAKKKGWEVTENDVVVVTIPEKVGTANEVAKKLKARNINLLYCYVTTSDGKTCRIVLRGQDADAIVAAVG